MQFGDRQTNKQTNRRTDVHAPCMKRIQDQKAGGQKGRRTKGPGMRQKGRGREGLLFDAPRTRSLDWADSNVECLLEFVTEGL